MDRAKHAGGRPRSRSSSATPEDAALAKFLWDLLDASGMSVDAAQRRLTHEHFPEVHQQIPSVSTLYKRLSGEGLAGAGRLVDALVEVCTPPERKAAVQRRADQLKAAVRAPRSQANTTSPSDDCRAHLTQLTQAQQRIILMQDEISRLKEGRQDSEKESTAYWHRLREDLERAESRRGQLESELAAARREIRTLRDQLLPVTASAQPKADPELDRVETELRHLDPDGRRFGAVLRRAFDIVYDGGRTGRFRPDQLSKVEKAQLLTLVVSELYRKFGIDEGQELDFRFDGVDVACVFSSSGAWMIPPEAASRLCLLVSADDSRSSFSVGLLRATPDAVNAARNRDGKSTVSSTGRRSIRYLVRDGALPENVLLHTSSDDVAVILAKRTGQERVFELFRRVRNRTVNRATLGAVTMQEDAAKRVRDARRSLAAEGLLVLGHATPRTCAALGLSLPDRGEYVSVRVARRRPHHGDAPHVDIGGDSWVLATPEDPVEQAPVIPTRSA